MAPSTDSQSNLVDRHSDPIQTGRVLTTKGNMAISASGMFSCSGKFTEEGFVGDAPTTRFKTRHRSLSPSSATINSSEFRESSEYPGTLLGGNFILPSRKMSPPSLIQSSGTGQSGTGITTHSKSQGRVRARSQLRLHRECPEAQHPHQSGL